MTDEETIEAAKFFEEERTRRERSGMKRGLILLVMIIILKIIAPDLVNDSAPTATSASASESKYTTEKVAIRKVTCKNAKLVEVIVADSSETDTPLTVFTNLKANTQKAYCELAKAYHVDALYGKVGYTYNSKTGNAYNVRLLSMNKED